MKPGISQRKALRKEKRKEKKQRKEIFYKRLNSKPEQAPQPKPEIVVSLQKSKKIRKSKEKPKKIAENASLKPKTMRKTEDKGLKIKRKSMAEEDEDERLIRIYEKKLGISQNKKKEGKYRKEMMKDGLEEGFFSLLERIHDSAKTPLEEYHPAEEIAEEGFDSEEGIEEEEGSSEEGNYEEINEEGNIEEEDKGLDEGSDENSGENEEEEEFEKNQEDFEEIEKKPHNQPIKKFEAPHREKNPIVAKSILKSSKNELVTEKEDKSSRKTEIISQNANLDLLKKLQSNLNKLAEGNIDSIFSQTVEIFNTNSKFVVNELFTSLFMKNIIENNKTLPHILACACAFSSGLHQIYDNEFFSELIRKVAQSFFSEIKKLSSSEANPDESFLISLKNSVLVFSHFYMFDSLSLDFMKEAIELLCEEMSSETIEVLLLMIQTIGMKVRKDSPKILKDLIDLIKDSFERFKVEKKKEFQKGEFLLSILNDVRMNKNMRNNPFETLGFLITWVKKNVISKFRLVPKVFSFGLKAMRELDFSKPKWWSLVENASFPQKQQENNEFAELFNNERRDYLEKLASEQKFLTTLRKKIFMVVMNADDYIEAFQNLLRLKLNRKQNQDLAVVLVECCAQENSFNKYYLYLIEKLIEARNELRFSVQYAFWDQFKLLENFSLRKICNLAKLLAGLTRRKSLNLSSLKGLELDEKNEHVFLFLKAFARNFLQGDFPKRDLGEIIGKMKKNEENLTFCEALYEYLKRKIYRGLEDEEFKEKMKSFLGFLKVEI